MRSLHHTGEIQALASGLCQMRIDGDAAAVFEPRRLEDIAFEPQPPGFAAVHHLSETLDAMYGAFPSPWVRLLASRQSADRTLASPAGQPALLVAP